MKECEGHSAHDNGFNRYCEMSKLTVQPKKPGSAEYLGQIGYCVTASHCTNPIRIASLYSPVLGE